MHRTARSVFRSLHVNASTQVSASVAQLALWLTMKSHSNSPLNVANSRSTLAASVFAVGSLWLLLDASVRTASTFELYGFDELQRDAWLSWANWTSRVALFAATSSGFLRARAGHAAAPAWLVGAIVMLGATFAGRGRLPALVDRMVNLDKLEEGGGSIYDHSAWLVPNGSLSSACAITAVLVGCCCIEWASRSRRANVVLPQIWQSL